MHTICEVPAKKIVRNLISSTIKEMHDKHGKAAFYTLCDGDIQHEYQLHESLKNLETFSINFSSYLADEVENALQDKLSMSKAKRAHAFWGDINVFCRNEAAQIVNGKKSKTENPRFFWFDYCSLASPSPTNTRNSVYNDFIETVSSNWSEVAVTNDCQIAVTFKVGARGLLTRGNWLDKTFFRGCQDKARSINHWHKPTGAELRAEFIAEVVLSDCSEHLGDYGWRCKSAIMYQSVTDRMMTIFYDRKNLPSETQIEKI